MKREIVTGHIKNRKRVFMTIYTKTWMKMEAQVFQGNATDRCLYSFCKPLAWPPLILFGLGGAKWPPEGFPKYLKNGLTDLHQTF